MKLRSAVFHGLPGVERLRLEFDNVNAFVGPNGAGKTTILLVVKLALDILSRKTVCGDIGDVPGWLSFRSVEMVFEDEEKCLASSMSDVLELVSDELSVKIICNGSEFFIEYLKSDSELHIVSAQSMVKIEDLRLTIEETERRIDETERQLSSTNNPSTREELNRLKKSFEDYSAELERVSQCEIIKPGALTEVVERSVLDDALNNTLFPSAVLVDSNKNIDNVIPDFIRRMCDQQSGKPVEKRKFRSALEDLGRLLQHEIDFHEIDGEKCLSIDGVDYRRASSGTRVSLAYFGLTQFLNPTDLVIWDEPENGLHPTRRIRILDLIQQDPRQFLIATHALEFAPIFAIDSKIYRCDSSYEEDAENTTLQVKEVTNRKDGFLLLEALGVQPARTLFTANVVLWVEGPTELVFYRHWLKYALQGTDLEEGFHYTIMHYGGGLIAYLEIADDEHRELAFDALSICRNVIIAIDSDRDGVVDGNNAERLKPGARAVKAEVDRLNASRPGSALFCVTKGREIENYLPPKALLHAAATCWQGYADHKTKFSVDDFVCGQHEPFHKALEAFFVGAGISTSKVKNDIEYTHAHGKSLWGEANKVAMMRAALTFEGLEPEDMLWEFSHELDQMVRFITQANAT
ncbi:MULTISPECIES: ATP-dependent nuclease [unclassified Pseudomonas]|uniref:ATP-dependent nuclease n=1 Tax=unclassified Pseudomonas TaxID=196821 RepID=UPI0025F51330|nr:MULTISPECIES: ATP-binding protein [unclassified Pseudomonas]